jgi:membrane protease YdiL (CAAX protease family)
MKRAQLLWVASLLGSLLSLPYLSALLSQVGGDMGPKQPQFTELASNVVSGSLVSMIMIWAGLSLGIKIGLGTTMLEGLDDGKHDLRLARETLLLAMGIGLFLGVLTAGVALGMDPWISEASKEIKDPPAWTGFLASFGAALQEEIWLRLGCLTLLAWLGTRLSRKSSPGPVILWIANIVAALLFAALHLPQAILFVGLTLPVVLLVFIGNGLPGMVFGWLYWRKGLGAAMLAHFTADIVLHVVLPLFAK